MANKIFSSKLESLKYSTVTWHKCQWKQMEKARSCELPRCDITKTKALPGWNPYLKRSISCSDCFLLHASVTWFGSLNSWKDIKPTKTLNQVGCFLDN